MTDRQEKILGIIVKEYIDSAIPVGSSLIADHYDFDLSTATLRAEMLALEKDGYLYQPYTSAGRVPTDKGFRFFVDKLMEQRELDFREQKTLQAEVLKLRAQNKTLARMSAKMISSLSGNLAVSGLIDSEDFYKSGMQKLVSNPEFNNLDSVCKLAEIVDYLEENALELFGNLEKNSEAQIFIGKENSSSIADECSMVVSRCDFGGGEEGLLAIIGPKRMKYSRNVSIIEYFKKLLGGNLVLILWIVL